MILRLRLRPIPAFSFAIAIAAILPIAAEDEESAPPESPIFSAWVRTTAYTHTEADHLKYGKKTALGTELRYSAAYHSVAADWSRFPLGTKFRIKGYDRIFVVDDYGKALVGSRTIDLYFPNRERMNNWGSRTVQIDVVEFGSFRESFKILAGRGNHPHCLAMLSDLMKVDWSLRKIGR